MENNGNNKTQSRREFFKEASKRTLPILGFALFASTPFLTSCGKDPEPSGCYNSCSKVCSDNCSGTCSGGCNGSSTSSGCSSCGSSCNSSCGSNCAEICSRSCGDECSNDCGNECSNGCNTTCANDCGNNCTNSANNSPNDTISEASGSVDGYEYVDLGLSVKWARCNVGATRPQDDGRRELNPVNSIYPTEDDLRNFLVSNGYWTATGLEVEIAGNSNLDLATKFWGNAWHSPSKSEWEELKNNCDYELFVLEGVTGIKLKSRINGNSIFISLNPQLQNIDSAVKLILSTYYSQIFYFSPFVGSICKLGTYANHPFNLSTYNLNDNQHDGSRGYIRAVTTGSGGITNCNGNCTNTATNNCSSCQIGCSTSCLQQCSSNCTTGCKTGCTGSCVNGCNTLCGGSCHYSCGGTCSYVSAGSHCTAGTCATTCSNYCYRTCTLACSQSCMSCCITSSK